MDREERVRHKPTYSLQTIGRKNCVSIGEPYLGERTRMLTALLHNSRTYFAYWIKGSFLETKLLLPVFCPSPRKTGRKLDSPCQGHFEFLDDWFDEFDAWQVLYRTFAEPRWRRSNYQTDNTVKWLNISRPWIECMFYTNWKVRPFVRIWLDWFTPYLGWNTSLVWSRAPWRVCCNWALIAGKVSVVCMLAVDDMHNRRPFSLYLNGGDQNLNPEWNGWAKLRQSFE